MTDAPAVAGLRTYLFTPGDQQRKLDRASAFRPDALIIDLEDAVPIGLKDNARANASEFLARATLPTFVRVNAAGTPWSTDDVTAVVRPGLTGVVLPMVDDRDQVTVVAEQIAVQERATGLAPGSVELVILVETAKGILGVADIVADQPRVSAIAFGAYDFANDMDLVLTESSLELQMARFQIALAARAYGKVAVDSAFAKIADIDALVADTRRARSLGFAGKFCIHPTQIAPVAAAFGVSAETLARARRIVQEFEAGLSRGVAAIIVDGELVDPPIYDRAKALLASARTWGEPFHHPRRSGRR